MPLIFDAIAAATPFSLRLSDAAMPCYFALIFATLDARATPAFISCHDVAYVFLPL